MHKKILKTLVITLVFMSFAACTDEDSNNRTTCSKPYKKYENDQGTSLIISEQNWYIEHPENGFLSGGLHFKGEIVGDSIKSVSYGDGLFGDVTIPLNSKNQFDFEWSIFFSTSHSGNDTVVMNVPVYVYNGQDTLEINLSSCSLLKP